MIRRLFPRKSYHRLFLGTKPSPALARFSNEAAVRFNAARQVPAKEDLQRLATEAGFSDVRVRVNRMNIRLPVWINSHWTISLLRQLHRISPLRMPKQAGKSDRVLSSSCCRRWRLDDRSRSNACVDGSSLGMLLRDDDVMAT
jgi:hypothetical protein